MVRIDALTGLVAVGIVGAVLAGFTIAKASNVGGTTSTLSVPVTSPSQAAPQETGWSVRVTMKGCGQNVSAGIRANHKLLVVNGGTIPRYRLSWPSNAPPYLLGAWAPRDWREYAFAVPGTYVLKWHTSYCTLPAPKLTLKVNP